MTSPNRMMKNTCVTVVLKYRSSDLLQRKDRDILVQKVAKQWKLQSNGHLTYSIPHNNHNLNMYSLQYFSQFQQGCRKLFRAGGGESRERGIQGAGGNSQAAGRIAHKRHFAIFCYYNFLGNISTIKTSSISCTLAPLGTGRQGQSPTLAPLSSILGLIYQFRLRKSQQF